MEPILPSARIHSSSHGNIYKTAFESPTPETDSLCAGVETALKNWENPVVRDQLDKLLTVVKLVDHEHMASRERAYNRARENTELTRTMNIATEMLKKGILSKTQYLKLVNGLSNDE